MSITSGIVFFMVVWALVFYMINPLWQTSQSEAGEVEPGTPHSAPVDAKLAKKALLTTAISAVVFGAILYVIEWRVITIDDLDFLGPPNTRIEGSGT
ncbi:MAG: DUF1467 family protein [Paracoccaceae bacterium]